MNNYKATIVFKHLPYWNKTMTIEAKSTKKAEDVIRRMFRDKILKLEIKEVKK